MRPGNVTSRCCCLRTCASGCPKTIRYSSCWTRWHAKRARRLRPQTALGAVAPWSSLAPSDLRIMRRIWPIPGYRRGVICPALPASGCCPVHRSPTPSLADPLAGLDGLLTEQPRAVPPFPEPGQRLVGGLGPSSAAKILVIIWSVRAVLVPMTSRSSCPCPRRSRRCRSCPGRHARLSARRW